MPGQEVTLDIMAQCDSKLSDALARDTSNYLIKLNTSFSKLCFKYVHK